METKFIIHFQDNHQDCLKWHINEMGEVIKAEPFQSKVWTGCNVLPDDMSCLQKGEELEFMNQSGALRFMKHRIDHIEIL